MESEDDFDLDFAEESDVRSSTIAENGIAKTSVETLPMITAVPKSGQSQNKESSKSDEGSLNLQQGLVPENGAKKQASPLNKKQEGRNGFDDSDDEMLSQIDDNGVFENSQVQHQTIIPSPPIDVKLSMASISSPVPKTVKTPGNDMGPPTTSIVPKNPTTPASITPKTQSSRTCKNQESNAESNFSPPSSDGNTGSSREAFFANWDSDELSRYEERLQTLKRRFPGPAGLLPKITLTEVKLLDNSEHPLSQQISKIIASDLLKIKNEQKSLGIISRSREKDVFRITKAPWRELLKVLDINPKKPDCLLHFMNLRWVRRTVSKHPVYTKIPFLALVVQEEPGFLGSKRKIRDRPTNPSIKLMDPSGIMFAAMDAKFVEMYGSDLSPGTAIAVRNSGFLRFKRQVILTITMKNVICMTTMKKTENIAAENEANLTLDASLLEPEKIPAPIVSETNEGVRVLKFCDFCPSKAIEEYQQILRTDLEIGEEQSSPPKQPKLFCAVGEKLDRSSTLCNPGEQVSENVPCPKPDFLSELSAFGDSDDEELMQAFDNVDWMNQSDRDV